MAMIDDATDISLDQGAAQLLIVDLLTDRRGHQMRAGEEDRARSFDDVGLVAHDR